MVEYKYAKKEINLKQLIEETGLNPGFKIKGDKMWFIFEEELNVNDFTKLNDAVKNHVAEAEIKPTPTPAEEKINQIKQILGV